MLSPHLKYATRNHSCKVFNFGDAVDISSSSLQVLLFGSLLCHLCLHFSLSILSNRFIHVLFWGLKVFGVKCRDGRGKSILRERKRHGFNGRGSRGMKTVLGGEGRRGWLWNSSCVGMKCCCVGVWLWKNKKKKKLGKGNGRPTA